MNCLQEFQENPDAGALLAWMRKLKMQAAGAGVFALVPEQDKQLVGLLQSCAVELGMPLVGGVFPELLVQGRFCRKGVLLLGLDPMPAHRLIGGLSRTGGQSRAVTELAALVDKENEPEDADGTLLLMFDGLYGHTASLLVDLYYETGDLVRYAGINAGSETFQPMPCLFNDQTILDDAVLAMFLPHHPGAVLEHGYEISEAALTASAATNNRIVRIGLEPAFDQYVKIVQSKYGQEITRENFYLMGVHFPFALVRANGELLIRIPVAVDDEGALFCVGEVPEGSLLAVARAAEPGASATADKVAADYAAMKPAQGLFFYCAGRRMHMGVAAAEAELGQLARALPGVALNGALTLGEIGNSSASGYPLFHNATLVALPMGGKR